VREVTAVGNALIEGFFVSRRTERPICNDRSSGSVSSRPPEDVWVSPRAVTTLVRVGVGQEALPALWSAKLRKPPPEVNLSKGADP
jgi:hypothetical protein